MAAYALVPGVPAAVLAFVFGSLVHVAVGVSAALGAVVAVGGFCGQVLALGWARRIGPGANQAVAYMGFLLLIGVAVVAFVTLRAAASWFAPKAFWGGLFALVPVAAYVTHLARRGRIAEMILDADRAATKAAKGPA